MRPAARRAADGKALREDLEARTAELDGLISELQDLGCYFKGFRKGSSIGTPLCRAARFPVLEAGRARDRVVAPGRRGLRRPTAFPARSHRACKRRNAHARSPWSSDERRAPSASDRARNCDRAQRPQHWERQPHGAHLLPFLRRVIRSVEGRILRSRCLQLSRYVQSAARDTSQSCPLFVALSRALWICLRSVLGARPASCATSARLSHSTGEPACSSVSTGYRALAHQYLQLDGCPLTPV